MDEVQLGKHDGKEVASPPPTPTSPSPWTAPRPSGGEESIYYELEGEGTVLFCRGPQRTQDGQETVRTAVRKGGGLSLTTQVGDRKTERTLPMVKSTLALQRRLEEWLQTAKKGDTFDNWTTSWDQDIVDVKEVYTFKEKKTITLAGVDTEAYAVQTVSQGARFEGELLGDARPLVGKVGVMEMRMEKEPLAKKLDEDVDLMAATSIPVDKDIGRGSRIEKLKLEVTGLDDYPLPESARQKIVLRKDGVVVLEMSRDRPTDKPAPLTDEERKENLKATASMQADSDKLRDLAKEIVGDEKDPLKMATKLEKWVYKNAPQDLRRQRGRRLDGAGEQGRRLHRTHTAVHGAGAGGGDSGAAGGRRGLRRRRQAVVRLARLVRDPRRHAVGDGGPDVQPGLHRPDAHQVQRGGGGPGVSERGGEAEGEGVGRGEEEMSSPESIHEQGKTPED